MSNGRKILDGLEDALSRKVSRYTNIYTADMSDLERARRLLPDGTDGARTLAGVIAAARREGEVRGAKEMRERAAQLHRDQAVLCEQHGDDVTAQLHRNCLVAIRALPLTPEEPT